VEVDGQCHGLFVLGSSSVDREIESELVFVDTVIRQVAGVIRYQISKEVREEAFREQLTGPDKFLGLVGRSQPMQKIYRMIRSVADSSSTVLITGESGTGKEMVALLYLPWSTRRSLVTKKGPLPALSARKKDV